MAGLLYVYIVSGERVSFAQFFWGNFWSIRRMQNEPISYTSTGQGQGHLSAAAMVRVKMTICGQSRLASGMMPCVS